MADGVDQQQTTDTVEEPLDLIRLSLPASEDQKDYYPSQPPESET